MKRFTATKNATLSFSDSSKPPWIWNQLSQRQRSKQTTYDVLYGVLKTHELELVQKRAIQSSLGTIGKCAFIAGDPVKEIEESSAGQIKREKNYEDLDDLLLDEEEKSDNELYTLEDS